MKICLTNHALDHYYGTETWTYAMAEELALAHKVMVFTNYPGKMANKVSKFAEVTTIVPEDVDLFICNHTSTYIHLPKDKPIIYTTHGRFGIEIPPPGIDYVGVTEEVAKGHEVIRNGVNCERFRPITPIREKLQTVLYLSHPDYGRAKELVAEACRIRGVELITINEEIFEIETLIDKADLVISLGRGIIESLACGRNVISADWRDGWMDGLKGGGLITPDNFDKLKTHAFSGRNDIIEFTPERLADEIGKYDPGLSLRDKILDEFNIAKTCKQYLTLSRNAI